MKILIIGNDIGHEIQKVQASDDDPLRIDKQRFEQTLRNLIADYRIEFIGEEFVFGSESAAQQLGLPWANIDMDDEMRKATGISKEQKQRNFVPRWIGDDAKSGLTSEGYQRQSDIEGWVTIERRLESDSIREDWMFDQVVAKSGAANSVLVICGIQHAEKLAEKFRRDSTNVVEVKSLEEQLLI
ncbi:MAG TPA: hypothetical protein VMD58_07990 [Acidobacteriaceae bacterium]|nr:hypothetical protein [Acidobacteriaceae bacterium]